MPFIAVVVSGLSGRMHSGFELISRLEGEGHRVICLCQPYTTEVVARQGFEYLEIPEINFNYSDSEKEYWNDNRPESDIPSEHKAKTETQAENNPNATEASDLTTEPRDGNVRSSWFQKWAAHLQNRHTRYEQGKKRLQLEIYGNIWSELRPDYALIDVELHDLIFTAYAAEISITLFHTWFSDTPSAGLPPVRTTITPGKGFSGSSPGIAFARFVDWAKIRARWLINQIKFQEYRRSTLKKYAREVGFPVQDLALSTLPPLYRFKKLPILLLALKELDFPHRMEQNIHYVGPMVYEKRQDLDPNSPDSQRLDTLFESKKATGKKLIYCAVGSLAKGDVSFLKKVIQIAGEEKDWSLILSLGRNLSQDIFSDVPKNVYLFAWVPQLKVLSHADACINHAGINSINECLHYAVPMVIYSLKYTDENGNAARMAYHGLAISGDKDEDDAETIRSNIKAVLNEPKYRKTVSKFNGMYQEYRQRKLTPLLFRGNESR
ncbi:MAG: nucleotide disphospho-sugar-binding domain-containing protein [Pricia sp.]